MPGKILGLDIGEDTIKAVRVTAGLKGYQVIDSAVIDIKEAGGAQEALKRLFENNGFKSDICITSLTAKSFSFRNIKLPFKDKKKIDQTIAYELEPLLPYPPDDILIDYIIADRSAQTEIFAAAVTKSAVGNLIGVLKENRIEASVIEIDPASVVQKLLAMEIPPCPPLLKGGKRRGHIKEKGCGLLLDIGAINTAGVLFKDGRIFQIRHYPFGGDTISGVVAKSLNIEFPRAEEKKRMGETDGAEKEISKVCREFFLDVKRTLRLLELKDGLAVEPSKIFLTGGGALYSALREEMEEFFSVPVETVDLSAADNIRLEEKTKKNWIPMLMNHALALAARETKSATGLNFARGEFGPKRKYGKIKKDIGKAAALLFLILFLLGADSYTGYHYDRIYLDKLKDEITSVFKKTCPEVTRIVDPVQQLRVKIAEVKKVSTGSGGIGAKVTVLNVLKDVSRLIPASVDSLITSFVFDNDTVQIKGETDNFNTVDNIKNSLDKSRYFKDVTISSASLIKKGSRVGFNLRIELK